MQVYLATPLCVPEPALKQLAVNPAAVTSFASRASTQPVETGITTGAERHPWSDMSAWASPNAPAATPPNSTDTVKTCRTFT